TSLLPISNVHFACSLGVDMLLKKVDTNPKWCAGAPLTLGAVTGDNAYWLGERFGSKRSTRALRDFRHAFAPIGERLMEIARMRSSRRRSSLEDLIAFGKRDPGLLAAGPDVPCRAQP